MINRYSILSFFMLLFVSLMLVTGNVYAQGVTTAAMNGVVVDQKGDALPGANILAVHTPSGTQYGTTSRVDGKYNLNGLRTGGPYTITVSYVGYKPQISDGINLQLGQNLKLNYTLYDEAVELGDITVVGEKNAIISSNRTGAGQNVTAKDMELLPTINRSFQDFAKLSPQSSGNSNSIGSRNNRYNNIQIDGTQYNDIFGLGASGTPGGQTGTTPISLDAIEQFQVVVAPYDVKYSGFTGGGINAITRSGTNVFRGSVYGFGRNESLVGNGGFIEDKTTTSMNEQEYPEFKEYQAGFRLGGPIVKDKLFFFVNGEIAARDLPLSNISLVTGADTLKTLAARFEQILKDKGMLPGTKDAFTVEQPSNKFFVRLDLNQSENHKITLRHNYVNAYKDILDGRSANNTLSFSTLAYRIKNITNSTVLQINSTNNENLSNEFILGFTSIRDRRAGITEARPEIRVFERAGTLIAGPDRFSSANELDQDILELTDNFSVFTGNHVITLGTHNEFFTFRNLFIRSFYGYYEFDNLAALESGTPSKSRNRTGFERAYSKIPGDDKPAARFSVNQLGFYIQDEWSVIPTFKVTVGVRADIPFLPTEPGVNDSVSKYFPGYSTGEVPSGNVMFSPRLGLNWDIFGDRSTQIRGGVGIFTGRVPYVWMSNNYGNTGLLLAQIGQNTSTSAPFVEFSVDPYNQPGEGDQGTTPPGRSEINIVDPDFKFPQILRANLGIDQELPWGIIGTAEFIYSKSINDLIYEKLNIGTSTSSIVEDGRPKYGGTLRYNNFNDVLLLKNTDEGYSYNISAQLQRNVDLGLSFNAAYTYGVAKDVNSVLSSQAQSQIRFNPIAVDANKPPLTTSSFDLGHRAFVSISYSYEFFANSPTTISFYYNYQSGRPFSFIVNGDLNNDGFNGNDLFYIPKENSEILLGTFDFATNTYTADAKMYADLNEFIDNNDYLSQNRGKIAERNESRNPWNDALDFRIAQAFSTSIGQFQLSLDIQNVMNLLNSEWGWFQTTPQDTYNMTQIVTDRNTGAIAVDPATGKYVYTFTKPANNTPWSPSDLSSRWQMQLGLRYSF